MWFWGFFCFYFNFRKNQYAEIEISDDRRKKEEEEDEVDMFMSSVGYLINCWVKTLGVAINSRADVIWVFKVFDGQPMSGAYSWWTVVG